MKIAKSRLKSLILQEMNDFRRPSGMRPESDYPNSTDYEDADTEELWAPDWGEEGNPKDLDDDTYYPGSESVDPKDKIDFRKYRKREEL